MKVLFKKRSPLSKFEGFGEKEFTFKKENDILKYIEEYNSNKKNSWWIIDFKIISKP